ncbi:glypican-1-like [Erpetoichthys calabaricus]|uniref:Glypican-1 n=1 Tax=Erpetoichthys calabaricus TaxID=27687 RepID=A0A8C4S9D7_ERPCA|nr:glypican-1-like [Erpetoichthys calabaricus]
MDLGSLCWCLVAYVAASVAGENGNTKARNCAEVRQLYSAKGFSLSGVPQTEISGEHLRICPQGYTCCTSQMEENLANLSRQEFEGAFKDSGRSVTSTLNTQYKVFDGYFLDLLNKSERSLQQTFPNAYGEVYTLKVKIFQDLYADLRGYYHGSNINLEDSLNEFWTKLLERIFKAKNPQYEISDEYMECAIKNVEEQKPFGEIPREVKVKATRAFIAARSFIQGINMASEVVKKVSQVPLNPECTRAIMKMTFCPHCRGMPNVKPCFNYCQNVVKGCLANQADLSTEWQNLIHSMLQVVERFSSPTNVEVVIGFIHVKISDAMNNMLENIVHITNKVFQGCGNPKASSTRSPAVEEKRKRKVLNDDKGTAPSTSTLDKLVSDVTKRLQELQPYWIQLSTNLCNDKITAGISNIDKCWNGAAKGRYLPEVMGDGLASQINNPEVDVDITKPDMTIRQQIMQLKIMTSRLKNAYDGNDVDFQDTSDDLSGSGSGMGCPEGVCKGRTGGRTVTHSTKRPVTPNLKKQNASGAGSVPQPQSASFLLLAVISMLLLWR